MNNLLDGQKKNKNKDGEVDWNEKVADDDIRYVIACDMAADMLKDEY